MLMTVNQTVNPKIEVARKSASPKSADVFSVERNLDREIGHRLMADIAVARKIKKATTKEKE